MAKTEPFFSVVIPTLNEEKFLPRLLKNLAAETMRDFEVVLVDGKSEDRTVPLAKSFAKELPKLRIVTSDRRHVAHQRNLGGTASQGKILVFMDADCQIAPYFLGGLRYRWESAPADIVTCWMQPDVDNSGNATLAAAINLFLELQNSLNPTFLNEAMFSIKKSSFIKINGFDESMNYAEGKSIMKKAEKFGFTSILVHDPMYIFSFRRFRKFGTLNVAARIARLELAALLGIERVNTSAAKIYPMAGGTLFKKNNKAKSRFLKNFKKIFHDLNSQ